MELRVEFLRSEVLGPRIVSLVRVDGTSEESTFRSSYREVYVKEM